MGEERDWDETYRKGQTPWDSGRPCSELVRLLEEEVISPCKALDLGCGTGTNSIYLAQMGFDVTGVDISQVAIETAREKADAADVSILFMLVKLPNRFLPGKIFDFVFDRGCFHALKIDERPRYAEMLKEVTVEGSLFLLLTGNAKEPKNPGPPTMTEDEIRETFSQFFDFLWIREFRFDTTDAGEGPLGFSSLMKRKTNPL